MRVARSRSVTWSSSAAAIGQQHCVRGTGTWLLPRSGNDGKAKSLPFRAFELSRAFARAVAVDEAPIDPAGEAWRAQGLPRPDGRGPRLDRRHAGIRTMSRRGVSHTLANEHWFMLQASGHLACYCARGLFRTLFIAILSRSRCIFGGSYAIF